MEKCPVTSLEIISALIAGKFTAMTEADMEGFAGIEYEGYICEDLKDDCVIILDHGPGGMEVQVTWVHPDSWEQRVWRMHVDYADEMEQIV